MKKLTTLFALAAVLGLTACGPTSAPTETPTETPTSAPTETPTETPTEAPTTEPDTKVEYYVTVQFEDETPFEGAKVQACTLDETKCFFPVTTDADGKATLKLDPDSYVLHILNVPEGYQYDSDGYIVSEEVNSVTMVLYSEQSPRQW